MTSSHAEIERPQCAISLPRREVRTTDFLLRKIARTSGLRAIGLNSLSAKESCVMELILGVPLIHVIFSAFTISV